MLIPPRNFRRNLSPKAASILREIVTIPWTPTHSKILLNFRFQLLFTVQQNATVSISQKEAQVNFFQSTKLQQKTNILPLSGIYFYFDKDRYILFGNHRDAWVFGAIDPSSGTATMLEIVRAFGEMLKTG